MSIEHRRRTPEKFKDVAESDFKPLHIVVFNEGGEWTMGIVPAAPNVGYGDGKMTFDILDPATIALSHAETSVAPRIYENLVGKPFAIPDKTGSLVVYTAQSASVGPNGELEYTLIDPTNPTNRLEHINQETLEGVSIVEDTEAKIAALKLEIETVKTVESKKLSQELVRLEGMMRELEFLLGPQNEWADYDQQHVVGMKEKMHLLQEQMEDLVAQLDAETKAAQKVSNTTESLERKKRFESITKEVSDLVEQRKNVDADELDSAVRAWQERKDFYAQLVKQHTTKTVEPGKNGKTTEKTDLAAVKADYEANKKWAYNFPKAYEVFGLAYPPKDSAPTLKTAKRDLSDAARLVEATDTWYAQVEKTTTGWQQSLQDAVNKKRQEQAQAAGHATDYPHKSAKEKADFRKKTVDIAMDIVKKWEQEKVFDAVAEKQEITQKIADMKAKSNRPGDAGLTILFRELDVLQTNLSKTKETDLTSIESQILVLWKKIGEIEVLWHKLELTDTAYERKEGVVDIPLELMTEMLRDNAAGVRDIMAILYQGIIEKVPVDATSLKVKMGEFLQTMSIDPSVRAQLRQHGIQDWDVFVRRFEKTLSPRFVMILRGVAESEVESYMARTVSDIRAGLDTTWTQNLKDSFHASEFGQLFQTKAGLRTLLHVGLVGGVGIATNIATNIVAPVLPSSVRGGIVGAVMGAVKVGVQKLMGKSQTLESARATAKDAAQEHKKGVVFDALIDRLFSVDQTTGDVTIDGGRQRELSALFASVLRDASQNPNEAQVVEHNGEKVALSGNDLIAFNKMLQRAQEQEGLDVDTETRFKLASALAQLRTNRPTVSEEEMTPWFMRQITAFGGVLSGRSVAGQEVSGLKQVVATSLTGASVGVMLSQAPDAVRAGLGGVFGYAAGYAVAASREKSEKVTTGEAYVRRVFEILGSAGVDHAQYLLSCRVLRAALNGTMDAQALKGINVRGISDHAQDLVIALSQNGVLRAQAEAMILEEYREGTFEKESNTSRTKLENALATLRLARESSGETAENAATTKLVRFAKRQGTASAAALVGAGLSYLLPAVFRDSQQSSTTVVEVSTHGSGAAEGSGMGEEASSGSGVSQSESVVEVVPSPEAPAAPITAPEVSAAIEVPDTAVVHTTTDTVDMVGDVAVEQQDLFVDADGNRLLDTATISDDGGVELGEQMRNNVWGTLDRFEDNVGPDGQPLFEDHRAFVSWRQQQLEALGYQQVNGRWGHPFTVHDGAKIELYVDAQGEPHARLIGTTEGPDRTITVHDALRFREVRGVVSDVNRSSLTDEIGHASAHRETHEALSEFASQQRDQTQIDLETLREETNTPRMNRLEGRIERTGGRLEDVDLGTPRAERLQARLDRLQENLDTARQRHDTDEVRALEDRIASLTQSEVRNNAIATAESVRMGALQTIEATPRASTVDVLPQIPNPRTYTTFTSSFGANNPEVVVQSAGTVQNTVPTDEIIPKTGVPAEQTGGSAPKTSAVEGSPVVSVSASVEAVPESTEVSARDALSTETETVSDMLRGVDRARTMLIQDVVNPVLSVYSPGPGAFSYLESIRAVMLSELQTLRDKIDSGLSLTEAEERLVSAFSHAESNANQLGEVARLSMSELPPQMQRDWSAALTLADSVSPGSVAAGEGGTHVIVYRPVGIMERPQLLYSEQGVFSSPAPNSLELARIAPYSIIEQNPDGEMVGCVGVIDGQLVHWHEGDVDKPLPAVMVDIPEQGG